MRLQTAFVTISAALLLASPAAAVTRITTSAYALFSNIQVVDTVGVTIVPQAATSGAAAPGYDATNTVASLSADIDLGLLTVIRAGLGVDTGLLSSRSQANGGPTSGSGRSQVDDLGVNLFTRTSVLPAVTTLGITADTITSTTSVTVVGTDAVLSGRAVFENLDLNLLSLLNFSLGANAEVVPNFTLFNGLGLKIVLNEQIIGGNGTTEKSLTTNALRISFVDYLLGGRLLTGDLIVGNSFAGIEIDPTEPPAPGVPEPGVWLQMIAGFGLVGVVVRRRRDIGRRTVAA